MGEKDWGRDAFFRILPLAGQDTWDRGLTLPAATMGAARVGKPDLAI